MAGGKATHTADFYCTKCGKKGMPLARRKSNVKEKGHMKKLWCYIAKSKLITLKSDHLIITMKKLWKNYNQVLYTIQRMFKICLRK